MQRRSLVSEEGWLLSYADLITNLLIFFVMLLAAAEISKAKMQEISRNLSGQTSAQSLAFIQAEIEAKIAAEGLQDLISTDLTDDGLELSLNSGIVFDSGEGAIRSEMLGALDGMLRTLQAYGARYDFAVEGHTDSEPIASGSRYRSNWELSTERANSVRARLEKAGITRQHIKVEGYADTKQLPEATLAGLDREGRLARHRRVVVRMY